MTPASNGARTLKARDGDSAYLEDTRKVTEAVQRIQQLAADVRKESSMLGTAQSYAGSKKKVEEAVRLAKSVAEEARRRLQGLAVAGVTDVSEQKHRQLQQQKLTENLMGATRALEAASRAYEAADAERARRVSVAASGPGGPATNGTAPGVELHAMDAAAAGSEAGSGQQALRMLQDTDVSQAEVETHAAIVEEYTEQISSLSQDIKDLQRAMVDLADHTRAQGEVLDDIESNLSRATDNTGGATEQLVAASQQQRRGTKWILWLMLLATLIAATVIIVVIRKNS